MKLYELKQGTKAAFTPIVGRTCVFVGLTVAVMVCGMLGSLYFHLLRQFSMSGLICTVSCILAVILGLLAMLFKRNDDYKSFVACIMQFRGGMSEAECQGMIDAFLSSTQRGAAGFRSAKAENKVLLNAMLTGCKAIPSYADRGILTFLACIILRFSYAPFKLFALIDGILSGGAAKPNRIYRVMASTRWFPVRDRYSSSPIGFLFKKVVPIAGWIIASVIVATILSSTVGITSGMECIVWFGLLSLMLQLRTFGGNRNLMHRMALDISDREAGVIKPADYNLCMAFTQISPVYYQICVESGYIQSTAVQNVPAQEITQGTDAQMLP